MGNRPPGREASATFINAPVPDGVTRICVAGAGLSPYVGRARKIATQIAHSMPAQYETWFLIDGEVGFYDFTKRKFDDVPFPEHLKGHSSMPFCWLERGADAKIEPLGGCDHLQAWAKAQFPNDAQIQSAAGPMEYKVDLCHNGCAWYCFCFACCCTPDPAQTSKY